MRRIINAAIAAIAVILLGVFLFWVGGYDFDQRNHDVAAGVFVIIAASLYAAFMAYIISPE